MEGNIYDKKSQRYAKDNRTAYFQVADVANRLGSSFLCSLRSFSSHLATYLASTLSSTHRF